MEYAVLLSMTGFGSKSVHLDLAPGCIASLTIELKSVNGRFFEVVSKLPSALSSSEVKMISRLQSKLKRGRIYLTIRFDEDNGAFEEIVPSINIAKGYLKAAQLIKDECKIAGELSIDHLFQLPNIFVAKRSSLTEEQEEMVLKVIDDVADALTKTRGEEGTKLAKDISKSFAICREKMTKIEGLSESVMAHVKKEIAEKLELVEKGDEVAKIQLDDLYAQLNKVDVHEEITRFKSHLQSTETVLANPNSDDKGKRLDFILQELLREANTTMAKCTNFEVSTVCVDIKVELEKAREQVQNIL